MNTFNTAELVQLSIIPEMVYDFSSIQMQELSLTEYQEVSLRAIVCNLVGVGITKIESAYKVGRVMSMNVTPFRKKDPTLLVCKDMNLSKYYEIWSSAVGEMRNWNGWDYDHYVFRKSEFAEAIRLAVRSARNLTKDETVFAIIEMLKFQNEMMCR